jgi:hypothetical protein
MAAAVLPIILGISAVATGLETYSAFNQPKAPVAPTQTQTSTQQAEAAQAAAQAQATALMQRRGMSATVLTSPMGVTGSTQTQRATLGA